MISAEYKFSLNLSYQNVEFIYFYESSFKNNCISGKYFSIFLQMTTRRFISTILNLYLFTEMLDCYEFASSCKKSPSKTHDILFINS